MNLSPHFEKCFDTISNDERLGITHLCIYTALFQCWNKNDFINPIQITRREIMRRSKVNAKTTYHKCIKELQADGYIKYQPSYKPEGSLIYLLNF